MNWYGPTWKNVLPPGWPEAIATLPYQDSKFLFQELLAMYKVDAVMAQILRGMAKKESGILFSRPADLYNGLALDNLDLKGLPGRDTPEGVALWRKHPDPKIAVRAPKYCSAGGLFGWNRDAFDGVLGLNLKRLSYEKWVAAGGREDPNIMGPYSLPQPAFHTYEEQFAIPLETYRAIAIGYDSSLAPYALHAWQHSALLQKGGYYPSKRAFSNGQGGEIPGIKRGISVKQAEEAIRVGYGILHKYGGIPDRSSTVIKHAREAYDVG